MYSLSSLRFYKILGVACALWIPSFALAKTPLCDVFATQTVSLDLSPGGPLLSAQFVALFSKGAADFAIARHVADTLIAFPDRQREEVLTALGQAYRRIPKQPPGPLSPRIIGGRRLVDVVLARVERYDLRFQQAIAQGGSAEEAYQNFFQSQVELFASGYSFADIWQVIRFIKGELTRLQGVRPGIPLRVLLAGSVLNGKGNPKESDWDLSLTHNPQIFNEVEQWQSSLENLMSYPKGTLRLSAHAQPAAFFGSNNPIVIDISSEKVDVLVFGPAVAGTRSDQLFVTSPTIYKMNSNGPEPHGN